MASIHENFPGVPAATTVELQLAHNVAQSLAGLSELPSGETVRISIQRDGHPDQIVSLPPGAIHILNQVLAAMTKCKPVTLIPADAELNLNQAADLLMVSRQFLIELLEKGEIPSRMVGPQRMVLYRDVLSYKKDSLEQRLQALDELVAEGQQLHLGY